MIPKTEDIVGKGGTYLPKQEDQVFMGNIDRRTLSLIFSLPFSPNITLTRPLGSLYTVHLFLYTTIYHPPYNLILTCNLTIFVKLFQSGFHFSFTCWFYFKNLPLLVLSEPQTLNLTCFLYPHYSDL